MNRKKSFVILVSLLCCLTEISAQETNEKNVSDRPSVYVPINIKKYEQEPQKFPIHLCSIYPWGIHGQQSKNHIYNISLSLIVGKVRGMNGLQISGLYSQAPDGFNGIQIAGLGGNSAGRLKGVQIGGVTNYTVRMRGIQISGLANAGADNAAGIQISGIVNAAGSINGVQIGGIGSAAQNMNGIQIGGVSTIAQNMNGLQISGTYNRIDTLKGVSISIASFADTIAKGFSLSLVNIVKQGYYKEWELSFSDYANVAISYRMGTPKFYTVYTTGARFIEDKYWITGVGFGNRTPVGKRFALQPELVYSLIFPTDFKNIQNVNETRFKLGLVYRVNEKISVALAPSVYLMYENKQRTTGFGGSLGIGIQ